MREIKFRALDTITNKMHNSIEELCFENGILIEVIFKKSWDGIGSCADEVVDWQNADQTILMQYTGLKDKNGVEIYENDIVQFTAFGRTVIGVIEWDMDDGLPGFVIVDIDGSGTIWSFLYDDLAVIGNIYENPELLE